MERLWNKAERTITREEWLWVQTSRMCQRVSGEKHRRDLSANLLLVSGTQTRGCRDITSPINSTADTSRNVLRIKSVLIQHLMRTVWFWIMISSYVVFTLSRSRFCSERTALFHRSWHHGTGGCGYTVAPPISKVECKFTKFTKKWNEFSNTF